MTTQIITIIKWKQNDIFLFKFKISQAGVEPYLQKTLKREVVE